MNGTLSLPYSKAELSLSILCTSSTVSTYCVYCGIKKLIIYQLQKEVTVFFVLKEKN